jgi:hypothetical protein
MLLRQSLNGMITLMRSLIYKWQKTEGARHAVHGSAFGDNLLRIRHGLKFVISELHLRYAKRYCLPELEKVAMQWLWV